MIPTQPSLTFKSLLCMHPWFGVPEEEPLPGRPEDYRIEQVHADWFVVRGPDGEVVHSGIGPIKILPFHA